MTLSDALERHGFTLISTSSTSTAWISEDGALMVTDGDLTAPEMWFDTVELWTVDNPTRMYAGDGFGLIDWLDDGAEENRS